MELCRAFTGAWIETVYKDEGLEGGKVAPSQARGLKLSLYNITFLRKHVAPSQARGLKHKVFYMLLLRD